MKATELMIGDWVINPIHNDKARIEGVYFDKELCCSVATDGRFPQRFFNPIPLTTEILEKNGFVFREDIDTMYGEYYLHNQSTFAIKMFNGYLVGMCMGEDLEFYYVHELQHALRLCGLDTLADNFKI